jgi:hypothetical protein
MVINLKISSLVYKIAVVCLFRSPGDIYLHCCQFDTDHAIQRGTRMLKKICAVHEPHIRLLKFKATSQVVRSTRVYPKVSGLRR